LKYVERAAILCRLDFVPVNEIKPSHILALLEQCGKIKDRWSANSYNAYTRYISLLFSQLLQHQAVEFNPVRGIKKKKTIKNIVPFFPLKNVLELTSSQKNMTSSFGALFTSSFIPVVEQQKFSKCRVNM
jgi:hypothetical protein